MIELTLAVIAVLGFSFTAYEIQVHNRCTACEIVDTFACGDDLVYDPRQNDCVKSRDLL